MKREIFTYFLPPVYNTLPEKDLSLREVWEYISGRELLDVYKTDPKTGSRKRLGDLLSVTKKVREMPPEVYGDRNKGKVQYLPLVTFGGVFSQRDGEGLLETSGLINLDIDHISRLEGGVSLEELKQTLSQDREIGLRLLFTSPSGDGLKLVCKTSGEITDRESYRREFETLNYFVSQKYSLPIGEVGLDKGISDITRGCLLCFDSQAVLREWEDTFNPETHPIPKEESPRPRLQRDSRPERGVSSWDWEEFVEESLIPAIFERLDSVFPDMDFHYRGNKWESPYKLDGNPAKDPRREKSVVTQRVPGVILEQGGERVRIIDYYMTKNSLQFGEAIRELSRLCGLEEEYKDLSRRYAKMKDKETFLREVSSQEEEGRPTSQRPSQEETPEEKYKEYLQIQDLKEIASTKREGIKTGYLFRDSQGGEEEFIIPSGALTLICGKSSHGKSRLLQNIALRIAEREYQSQGDGVTLFFSFEEGLLEVVERFANIQVNIPQISQYNTKNTEVLRDYFQTGTLSKCPQDRKTEVLRRVSGFKTLYSEGRLRIYYTPDLSSGDLCGLLEYLSSQMTIKAVFLDYVQAIYKGEGYRKDRREELREICKELNKTAISLGLPIVLSAQLNRETPNPTDMSGDNIAESADITRYANTILLLWDSAKGRDIRGGLSSYLQTQEGKVLLSKGFNLGESGKIYAILSKNRGGTPDVETLLDYVPETGRIPENEDLPSGDTSFSGGLAIL
jgi:replicative DNA helicase